MRAGQVVVGVLIVLALLLAACGQAAPAAPTPAPAAPTKAPAAQSTAAAKVEYPALSFKLGQPFNPDHVFSQGMQKFADLMMDKSGGKIKVESFHSGSLVQGKTELDAIEKGVVDFGSVVPVYHAGELPFLDEITIYQLLYNYSSMRLLFKKARPQIEQELAKQKVKLLAAYPFTMGFFFKKAIDKMNPDFSGIKMRSPGGATTYIVRHFGASTVEMPSPDIPVALRTGVMQGLSTSMSSWDTLGIMEDVPFAYYGDYTAGASFMAMRQDKYASLPPAVQQLIDQAADESETWAYPNDQTQVEAIVKKAQGNPKVQVNKLTQDEVNAWRAKLKPVFDDFAKRHGDKGAKSLKFAEEALAETAKR